MIKVRYVCLAFAVVLGSMCALEWAGARSTSRRKSIVNNGARAEVEHSLVGAAGPQPQIVCTLATVDCGAVEAGRPLERKFVISNTGEGPLVLRRGWKSNNCDLLLDGDVTEDSDTITKTEPSLQSDITLAAGTSRALILRTLPTEIDATFSKSAHLQTNDPNREQVMLKMQARVVPRIALYPAHAWKMPTNKLGKPAEFKGALVSAIVADLQLMGIQSSDPYLKADYVPFTTAELEQNQVIAGYWINVLLRPGGTPGRFREVIHIETNLENAKLISCPLAGERQHPFRIVAAEGAEWDQANGRLDLGRFLMADGKQASISFVVTEANEQPLQLTDCECSYPYLTARLQQDSDFAESQIQKYTLELTVPAESPMMSHPPILPASLTLRTSSSDVPEWCFGVIGNSSRGQ